MLSRCLRVLIFTSFSFEYYLTSLFFSLLDCLFRLWLFGGWQLCVWISVRMCTCMRTDTCMYVNVKRNLKNNGHIFNARFKSIKVRSKRETSHSPPPPLARWGSRASPPSLRAANLISRESSHPPKSSHSCLRIPTAWNTFLGVSSRPGNYTQRAASERLGGGVNIE